MANHTYDPSGRVDPGRVEALGRQAEELAGLVGTLGQEGAQRKGQLLPFGQNAEAGTALGGLRDGLKSLCAGIGSLWDMREAPVEGLAIWDGVRRPDEQPALCRALDAWNPLLAGGFGGGKESAAPAQAPLLLWPKTRDENPFRQAIKAAGIQMIDILPPGAKEGFSDTVLSAEKALRLYSGELVILLCTDLACLPYADAFPNKLLWLAPPEDAGELSGEGYDTLYLRAEQVADIETAPGEEKGGVEKAAKQAAALYDEHKNAGADLVFLSSTNYDDLPRRPQHLARIAAEGGRRVLYVNCGARGEKTKLTCRDGSLLVFEMAAGTGEGRLGPEGVWGAKTPDSQRHLQAELAKILDAMQVRRAIVQVEHPFWAEPAFALRRERRLPVLFDYYDDFSVRLGAPAAELRRAEKSLLAGADFVVAASSALAKRAGQRGPRFATVRNGCASTHFSAAAAPREGGAHTPVLGFYGAISTTFNLDVIRALNDSGLEVEIRLIGKADPEVAKRLAACRKVKLLGEIPYDKLPEALAEFDLALLPYHAEHKIIEIASPAKFYEYLAAGKPIVGTAVPELMVFRGKFACLENDPGWFVRRVRECLDGISPLAPAEECVAFAAQNDWKNRAVDFDAIYRKLELARGRTIRGDIWAEQACLSDQNAPEKPMLALPPVEKKKKGENIPKMQLAGAMATLRELEGLLGQKDENTRAALEELSKQGAAPTGGVLQSLGIGKKEGPTPLQKAQKLLKENLAISERRIQNAFTNVPGTDVPTLSPVYTKYDVLFFAVTDFDQKQRRGAQLALRYAENGHRVFYVGAHFSGMPSVSKRRENLFLVELPGQPGSSIYENALDSGADNWRETLDGMMWHFGIRDALAVVAYPGWAPAAAYLKERFGLHTVVDYHSDFTGFIVPGSDASEENGMRLLRDADAVIPATEALATVVRQVRGGSLPDVVENGCDHGFFHAAFSPSQPKPLPVPGPDGKVPQGLKRPVVGYCGTISHWFDAEAVCRSAKALPEVDFVLAGQLVEWEQELRSVPNIRLLGEKPYDEIPALLATFDIAILPVDTEAEISDTLCPAAFYEYLAAGKSVVASNLPSLRPYGGKQVLLAESLGDFETYIRAILAGEDGLESAEKRAELAAEHDWQKRWETFSALAAQAVPSVSIILSTKNSLASCKSCIAGVLSKTALPGYRLIVVDRGSTDGTREMLKELEEEKLPNLRVILLDDDKSYTAGYNAGIREFTSEYVVLLQDYTLVTRGWLSAMLAHMEREEELGLCGPATNLGGGEAKVPVYYRSADEMAQYATLYTWQHLGETRRKGKSLSLFCAMLRRKTLQDLGPLDESYKGGWLVGYDLSMALRKENLTLAVAEDAFVHRMEPETLPEELPPADKDRFDADRRHFEDKWGVSWKPRGNRPGVTREMNLDSLFPAEKTQPDTNAEDKAKPAPDDRTKDTGADKKAEDTEAAHDKDDQGGEKKPGADAGNFTEKTPGEKEKDGKYEENEGKKSLH